MTLKFHAKALHTERTEDHVMVGFADDPVATTEFVMLTRGLEPVPDIPDEIATGLYFEYADQSMSGYGCVRSILLGEDRISIKIDRTMCRQIPHAEFVVTFDPKDPHAAVLPELLAELIGTEATFKASGGHA
ncbi:MAG: Imm10 family immunity protein [Hyphomicrobium sp.]|nr:Imm10 family immunity protein [Hyphomicrobium sp.]